jgi:hypothetical protein
VQSGKLGLHFSLDICEFFVDEAVKIGFCGVYLLCELGVPRLNSDVEVALNSTKGTFLRLACSSLAMTEWMVSLTSRTVSWML